MTIKELIEQLKDLPQNAVIAFTEWTGEPKDVNEVAISDQGRVVLLTNLELPEGTTDFGQYGKYTITK